MSSKPIVGIVARPNRMEQYNVLSTVESYRKAIIESGGIPISILPPQLVEYNKYNPKELSPLTNEEKEMIIQQIKLCDGVLLPGGNKRYEYDRFIVDYCLNENIPILGICLGMQLLATHLNRDTLVFTDDEFTHSKPDIDMVHKIKINKDSYLFDIIGEEEICVNSRHKYKVSDIGEFSVSGVSSDGVIEAIEHKDKKFAIGVQWHPENLMNTNANKKIFQRFIEGCRK